MSGNLLLKLLLNHVQQDWCCVVVPQLITMIQLLEFVDWQSQVHDYAQHKFYSINALQCTSTEGCLMAGNLRHYTGDHVCFASLNAHTAMWVFA